MTGNGPEDLDVLSIVDRIRAKADAGGLAEYERDRERREALRVDHVLTSWGVPKRVRNALAKFEEKPLVDAVRRWIAEGEESWCMVLSSNPGTGKSTAAGWWLSQVAKGVSHSPNASRRWWPATEVAALDFYGDDYKRLCECASLVLDDLGTEYSDQKGALQSKLDRLFDSRYREYRKTIVTANVDAAVFRERYGSRIYDRLCDSGARWVSYEGESLRRS